MYPGALLVSPPGPARDNQARTEVPPRFRRAESFNRPPELHSRQACLAKDKKAEVECPFHLRDQDH